MIRPAPSRLTLLPCLAALALAVVACGSDVEPTPASRVQVDWTRSAADDAPRFLVHVDPPPGCAYVALVYGDEAGDWRIVESPFCVDEDVHDPSEPVWERGLPAEYEGGPLRVSVRFLHRRSPDVTASLLVDAPTR